MRLKSAQVSNYKAITYSGVVEIEERVTVLIGKNEQGKTSFQRGLESLNPGTTYKAMDLPRHRRAELENTPPDGIEIVSCVFDLDDADLTRLTSVFTSSSAPASLRVTKFYDGHYAYSVIDSAGSESPLEPRPADISGPVREIQAAVNALKTKLTAHGERLPAFAPSIELANSHLDTFASSRFSGADDIVNLVKTLATSLKAVPGQDEPIQEDVAHTLASIGRLQTAIQSALASDFYAPIRQALPRFVFHHTIIDKIPDFVGIDEFIAAPETRSRGMANLCAVAGLSMQKLKQLAETTDAPEREAFEDHYKGTISGGINEFWTQQHYTVHFRLEPNRLSVSISDGSYASRIPPSDRSDGFQWYLSFYAAILNEVSEDRPLVLLLDNPGLELHADGQRDVKRFLEEKLPPTVQVIYVTHSAAMIDPHRLGQVRQVELLGDLQGTKVSRLGVKNGGEFDLLEPVRSAIGASLAYSLMAGDWNVLVEGAADKPILDAAFSSLIKSGERRPLVNGSVSENNELLPKFYERGRVPFVIFLDADSGARKLKASLTSNGIDPTRLVDLAVLFPDKKGSDFELEDVLSIDFYHRAVEATYPGQSVDRPEASQTGKRTKFYEQAYKTKHQIGFNKRRVAETVQRLWANGKGDAETAEKLKIVVEALTAALAAQVSAVATPPAARSTETGQ
jgi:hypothetical protein